LDEYGDAIDVEHYTSKDAAMLAAQAMLPLVVGSILPGAIVVEREVSLWSTGENLDKRTHDVVATFGSAEVLRAGGWQ
jgi:hypothetical protein